MTALDVAAWIVDRVRRDGSLPFEEAAARTEALFGAAHFERDDKRLIVSKSLTLKLRLFAGGAVRVDNRGQVFRYEKTRVAFD